MRQFVPNPETGLIFNIQHFCLHDGPGIRTAVFFCGCPLSCPWCCNPESGMLNPMLLHDKNSCTLCGYCSKNCKTGAISIMDEGWNVNLDLCTACGQCVAGCRYDALELSGQVYTVEQAADEVLKDRAFFDKSRGGVTLSGGEVLMQSEFAVKLAETLRQYGIHIACETTAVCMPVIFRRLMEVSDYMMIDVKHYDAEKLWNTCHADIEVIRENIRTAAKQKVPFVGRIPVIPGFNASVKDMEGFARFGKEMGIEEFHLLPFHQLGEEKYEHLKKEYRMKGTAALHKEDLEEYAEYLRSWGFCVVIGG